MSEFLVGQTAYGSGQIFGKVRVVKDASSSIQNGEIMVAEITTPRLFNQIILAKAIITDFGGQLCHTAILAREFKKPCIVGVGGASRALKDGDFVTIDLSKGEICSNHE